jgi:outer membrane receptor protein involved in Fe transport
VIDPSGRGLRTAIHLVSEANQYREILETNEQGDLVIQLLPFGKYLLEIEPYAFAPVSDAVVIRSFLPSSYVIQLKLPTVNQTVRVNAGSTLIGPEQAASVNQIGPELLQHRLSAIPGRSLQDLVNSQPGWLYEGNAVLHPRGSEYQTQFVIDGIPLTDNRSPSFGPEIEVDDVQSMSIFTAGIPAEYGRKMGGVIEVITLQASQPGFHGDIVLSGGSFGAASAFAKGQYSWDRNTFGGSAAAA